MASETPTATETIATTTPAGEWTHGVAGGLAGGLVFGAMMTATMPEVVEMGIPALVGLEGGLVGWTIHMSISATLGVVFAAAVGLFGLDRRATTVAGAGLVYGVVLWAALAVVAMPLWLGATAPEMAPPLPNVDAMSLVGHVVYGLVLGVVYRALE